jgi:hypothetical protein
VGYWEGSTEVVDGLFIFTCILFLYTGGSCSHTSGTLFTLVLRHDGHVSTA